MISSGKTSKFPMLENEVALFALAFSGDRLLSSGQCRRRDLIWIVIRDNSGRGEVRRRNSSFDKLVGKAILPRE
jgi:hypothetical protein